MKRSIKTYIQALLLFCLISTNAAFSQETPNIDVDNITREQVLELSYDDLLALPLEDLMKLAEVVGVSADELLEMILNRDVTSASKKAESLFEAPLSTSVVSADEIRNAGVTTIEEIFRLIPGMIVRQKTSGNYDVHIRGNDNIPPKNMLLYSENTMSLVMIDGRIVYNYAHGGTLWETLTVSVDDIERVEVIRGPATALYGPNAVSGAINIVTKTPETGKLSANANFTTGSLNTKHGNGDVSFGISDKLKVRLSGNYDYQDRHTSDIYVWQNAFTQPLVDGLGWLENGSNYYTYEYIEQHSDVTIGSSNYSLEKDFSKRMNDKNFGKDRYGANAYLFYDINDKANIDLSFGTQQSEVIATIFSNHNIPYNRRSSATNYANLRAKAYGFDLKLSYQNGTQNIEEGNYFTYEGSSIESEPYKYDLADVHASLEYDYTVGKLNIRPGFGYQQAIRDDGEYVDVANYGGFFNGKQELNSFAYFVRADYRPTDKIRLIAALRNDKYETPDKSKFTYQFIGSYTFNDKNLIRLVYSKANRGPFMADTRISYKWYVSDDMLMQFEGNENLKLAEMDMIELGYNLKPAKNIQVSIDAFYSKTKNFGFLSPNMVSLIPNDLPTLENLMNPDKYDKTIEFKYLNIPTEAEQAGVTIDLNWVVNRNLQIRPFVTWQQTKLNDYYPFNSFEIIEPLITDAITQGLGAYQQTGNLDIPLTSSARPDSTADVDHKSTPSIYGGVYMNYQPVKKLNINMNTYFYGKQTFVYQDETVDIDPKAIVNVRISYNVWGKHHLFVNAKNLISDTNEFAFTDKIGSVYLVGVNLSF